MSEQNTGATEDISMETVAAASEQPAQSVLGERSTKRSAIAALLGGELDGSAMNDAAFLQLFDTKVSTLKADDLVHGTVVSVTKDEILVDIGFKSLGVVPRAEFVGAELLAPGETVDVFVEKIEDGEGRLMLSRRRADFMKTWEEISSLQKRKQSLRFASFAASRAVWL